MLLTKEHAEKVRIKRGRLALTKTEVSARLGITRKTLAKIELGDYDAPRRIYQAVMDWLLEDY